MVWGRSQGDKSQQGIYPHLPLLPSLNSHRYHLSMGYGGPVQGGGHSKELKQGGRTGLKRQKHPSLGRYKRLSAVIIVSLQHIFLSC